jgi:hypothetical protein
VNTAEILREKGYPHAADAVEAALLKRIGEELTEEQAYICELAIYDLLSVITLVQILSREDCAAPCHRFFESLDSSSYQLKQKFAEISSLPPGVANLAYLASKGASLQNVLTDLQEILEQQPGSTKWTDSIQALIDQVKENK